MGKPRISVCLIVVLPCMIMLGGLLGKVTPVGAYNDQVYNSLLRTRDALLDQRKSIREAIAVTKTKLDSLNTHLKTLEDYLNQTESDLRDVDNALKNR